MNPTGRFSNRVEHYTKYRPGYPDAALDVLAGVLKPGATVADIGSGTGISSRWLRQRVGLVYAVEPNREMREAALEVAGIVPVDGTAEATGLADASMDAVVCATAFHWFRMDEARREFARILRPGGAVILLWNVRRLDGYERVVEEFAKDRTQKWDSESGGLAGEFFEGMYESAVVPNGQWLDWEGLLGRAMSASYMPLPGDPQFPAMEAKLRRFFEESQESGRVRFAYDTAIYWSRR